MNKNALMLNVRRLRRTRGLSQHALAHLAGVSRTTVHRLEDGHDHAYGPGTLTRVADALGVDVADLLGEPPSA